MSYLNVRIRLIGMAYQYSDPLLGWLGDSRLPFVIVLTKVDKVSQKEKSANLKLLKDELSQSWDELPLILESSAVKALGKDEILGFIENTNARLI